MIDIKAVKGKVELEGIMKRKGAQRRYHFIACDGGYEVFADFIIPSALADLETGRLYGGYGGRIYLGWSPVPE